jgi:hypothetical protein
VAPTPSAVTGGALREPTEGTAPQAAGPARAEPSNDGKRRRHSARIRRDENGFPIIE